LVGRRSGGKGYSTGPGTEDYPRRSSGITLSKPLCAEPRCKGIVDYLTDDGRREAGDGARLPFIHHVFFARWSVRPRLPQQRRAAWPGGARWVRFFFSCVHTTTVGWLSMGSWHARRVDWLCFPLCQLCPVDTGTEEEHHGRVRGQSWWWTLCMQLR